MYSIEYIRFEFYFFLSFLFFFLFLFFLNFCKGFLDFWVIGESAQVFLTGNTIYTSACIGNGYYLAFTYELHDEFVEHAVKFQSGDSFTVEDCGRMLQDPVHGKWVRYFAYGYPLILSSIPENRWEQNQLETDHPISNLRIEDRWFCTYVGFEQGSAQAAAPAAAPSKSDPEERAPRA